MAGLEQRYPQRLDRYTTAMRNEQPDRVPIRPFVAELPERSIVYHVDRGDILKVHAVLGDRFCLRGGLPNYLLSFWPAEEVRQYCRKKASGSKSTRWARRTSGGLPWRFDDKQA